MAPQTLSGETVQERKPLPAEPVAPLLSEKKSDAPALDNAESKPAENTPALQPLQGSGRIQSYSPVYGHQQGSTQSALAASVPRHSVNSPAAGSSGKSQTVFIHKLYDMLEDASLSHLIWWTALEDSFCLYPGEEFSNVLAQYFKHTNIASFIRQLNMYGFHKVNESFQTDDKHSAAAPPPPGQSPAPKWEFRHSANQFRKGDVESLRLIKRKSLKLLQSHKEIVNLKSLPPTSDAPVNVDHKPLASSHQGANAEAHNAALANQQHYHRSLMQLLWDQLAEATGTPSPKLPHRQPVYAPQGLIPHPPYAHYPGGTVLSVPIPFSPHSPRSPPPHEQPNYNVALPLRQQLEARQSSDSTQGYALDQAIHVKFIEITTSLNNLKTNYKDLLSKYDSLYSLYQRSQSDLLQLTEVLEKTLNKSGERGSESDDLLIVPKREEDQSDRLKTKTPNVDRCKTPIEKRASTLGSCIDMGTSPMSDKTQGLKLLELSAFRAQLGRKIGTPAMRGLKNISSLQSYHLHEPVHGAPKINSYNIVPQHYPLNPNYGLYSSSSEGAIRRHVQADEAQKMMQPAPSRHVSVLMDPLQPSPGHGIIGLLGKDDKGKDKEAVPKNTPVVSVAPERASSSTSQTSQTPYVQQYQPLALQANPLYYQHYQMRQEPAQMRTASLPVVSNPLTHKLAEHAHQRYSLANIPDHRSSNPQEADALRYLVAANSANAAAAAAAAAANVNTNSGQILTSNPVSAAPANLPSMQPPLTLHPEQSAQPAQGQGIQATHAILEGPVLAKPNSEQGQGRNQLPSMQELNKSLRGGPLGTGRVYDLLPNHGEPEDVKRRKFES